MTALENTFHLRVIAWCASSVRVTGRPPEWKTGEMEVDDGVPSEKERERERENPKEWKAERDR